MGIMMRSYIPILFLGLFLGLSGCSEQGFNGASGEGSGKNGQNNSQNGEPKHGVVVTPPDGGGNGGTDQNGPPAEPWSVNTADGTATLTVPLGKIEVTMEIDHVSDFIVNDTEFYIVHHEKAVPTLANVTLYDDKGAKIDTQGWVPNWGSCDPYPKYDANCASSKLLLKGGVKMKKIFTKLKGRGKAWKVSDSPFTARVTDCGEDCSTYGASGKSLSSTDTYSWRME